MVYHSVKRQLDAVLVAIELSDEAKNRIRSMKRPQLATIHFPSNQKRRLPDGRVTLLPGAMPVPIRQNAASHHTPVTTKYDEARRVCVCGSSTCFQQVNKRLRSGQGVTWLRLPALKEPHAMLTWLKSIGSNVRSLDEAQAVFKNGDKRVASYHLHIGVNGTNLAPEKENIRLSSEITPLKSAPGRRSTKRRLNIDDADSPNSFVPSGSPASSPSNLERLNDLFGLYEMRNDHKLEIQDFILSLGEEMERMSFRIEKLEKAASMGNEKEEERKTTEPDTTNRTSTLPSPGFDQIEYVDSKRWQSVFFFKSDEILQDICDGIFCSSDKMHHRRKLDRLNCFKLILARLCTGMNFSQLSQFANIPKQTTKDIYARSIEQLAERLKAIHKMPSKEELLSLQPKGLKKYCKVMGRPGVSMILDATEFPIENPKDPHLHKVFYSDYKHTTTAKFLIATAADGRLLWVSDGYPGRITDKQLVQQCGILDLIPSGTSVLVDKGFEIGPELMRKGVSLMKPPRKMRNVDFSMDDLELTADIANFRIHVERRIGRCRNIFHYFARKAKLTDLSLLTYEVQVAMYLTLYTPHLIQDSKCVWQEPSEN